jgi:hypothetical protein
VEVVGGVVVAIASVRRSGRGAPRPQVISGRRAGLKVRVVPPEEEAKQQLEVMADPRSNTWQPRGKVAHLRDG